MKKAMGESSTGIVAMMVVLLGAFFVFGGQGILQSVNTGGTTLSLQNADFSSSSSYFTGKQWILTILQGGMGQSWQGVVNKDQINQETGVKPTNNFYMNIEMLQQSCRYNIEKNTNKDPVYNYYTMEWDDINPLACSTKAEGSSHCSAGEVVSVARYLNAPFGKCFCIGRTLITNSVGSLKTPFVHTLTKVGVSKDGQNYKYSNVELPSGYNTVDFRSSGFDVVGSWNGYLVKDVCDLYIKGTITDYYTFYNGGWKIGQSQKYQNYLSQKTSFETWWRTGVRSYANVVRETKLLSDSSVQATTSVNPSNGNIGGSTTTPYYETQLQSTVANPLWTFYIKADWLGIYQPIPKARLGEVKSSKFKSGSSGIITADVWNDGGTGNINVWATCDLPFSVQTASRESVINQNSNKIFTIEIDANTDKSYSASCDVCAKGAGEPTGVCRSVAVQVEPNFICEPNQEKCIGDVVKSCNPSGSGWETFDDCSIGNKVCTYNDNGGAYCKFMGYCSTDSQCNDENICTNDYCTSGECKNEKIPECSNTPKGIDLGLVVLVLIPIITGLFMYMNNKKRDILNACIGVLIGTVVSIVLYIITEFILKNWLIILLGGVGGIVIFYILGGFGLIVTLIFFIVGNSGRRK